ncbi:hypothetical protein MMC22_005511 [Lobaria immixta]|nr:hypothetical protein [Lobaria immixta]
MSGRISNREEVSEEMTRDPFAFLKLPAEIRNEIYRLVLLTRNVATDEQNPYHPFTFPGEGAIGAPSGPPIELATGTIQCKSGRRYTIPYQIAILQTNRQIYREAWGIFHLENSWTIIQVNKAGFGKDMKDHGFPIATAGNIRRHVKFPVMEVNVIFPSLEDQTQSDDLAVATVHLKQVIRALWTAKGALEMEVTIHLQPARNKISPSERSLLRPFRKLSSIKRLDILGGSDNIYINELTRAVTSADSINHSIDKLTASVQCLQRHIKAERWGPAIAQATKHCILETDCYTVYGLRLIGVEPGIDTITAFVRQQIAKEIKLAVALAIGEVTLYMGQYASTVRFADRGLSHMLGDSVIFFPIIHSHHSFTGTITSVEEAKYHIYLVRACAYIGMERAEDAFRDINAAAELMPNSVMLASVYQDWEARFGPLPSFACRRFVTS